MDRNKEMLKKAIELVLPWLVLAILVAYSYATFFQHPFGFSWGTPDGVITKVFVNEREPTLHIGDRLVRVGSLDLQAFRADLAKDLLGGARSGSIVPITVERDDQVLTVQWRVPGTNPGEMRDQLFGPWFMAYFFWIAGAATLLALRPRDMRWFLISAFNFLTSIWLIAGGGLSFFHIWYSPFVLRTAVWMSLPVYLHLHWVFPRPLGKLRQPLVWAAYLGSAGFAVAHWFQVVPANLYLFALLAAIVGSLILLLLHFIRQPDMRRDLGFLLIAAVLAVVPSIALVVVAAIQHSSPPYAGLAFLSFPILPFSYLYAAYRRQLGGLEVRVNRLITIYAFLIVLGALIVPILVIISRLPVYAPDQALISSAVASILVTALSLWGFPIFQAFVERRFLGIAVPSRELQQAYSSHITSSTSFSKLTHLLHDEVLPSLLVRQFVFLVLENGSSRILLSSGVTEEQIPVRSTRAVLKHFIGRQPANRLFEPPNLAWIRLVLPLQVQDHVLGYWLFGRRDPDDLYSNVEVPILQSFANQSAVALSNILQTERLRALYQADINRHETERLSLARDLHDSVLSELAGMLMNADMQTLPQSFQDGYQALTQRLREIVSYLRPPMLNYGLKLAIEELADNLMERNQDTVEMLVDLQSTDSRYALEVEQHLYRIVQEACENAIRHSHGKHIRVTGWLEADRVEITIADDGQGFEMGTANIELYDLLSQRHFGMAGMLERAELIHAHFRIISTPGSGTQIFLSWHADQSPRDGTLGSEEFSS